MHTYLVVCGIILHIIALWVVGASSYNEICTRKNNKKKAVERANQVAAYKAEMELAKPVWQAWAKKMNELQQNYDKENDPVKGIRLSIAISLHSLESYQFSVIGRRVSLYSLGVDNDWALEEEQVQQTA